MYGKQTQIVGLWFSLVKLISCVGAFQSVQFHYSVLTEVTDVIGSGMK